MINKGMKAAFAKLNLHVSPAEILQQGLLHVVEFRKENPEWFTLLISHWTESVNNEKLSKELLELYKEMKSGIMEIIDRMELQLDRSEKETLASLIQAVIDGLTLQAPVPLSPEPISLEQVSRGIGWMLDGIRSAARRVHDWICGQQKEGAYLYKFAHTFVTPLLLLLAGLAFSVDFLIMIGFIWMVHIGMDRMMGYGLKYETDFKDTHIQRL